MTSPFRFDGRTIPETEEERRKRLLREAMEAAQFGRTFAAGGQPQMLPAMTITADADKTFRGAGSSGSFEEPTFSELAKRLGNILETRTTAGATDIAANLAGLARRARVPGAATAETMLRGTSVQQRQQVQPETGAEMLTALAGESVAPIASVFATGGLLRSVGSGTGPLASVARAIAGPDKLSGSLLQRTGQVLRRNVGGTAVAAPVVTLPGAIAGGQQSTTASLSQMLEALAERPRTELAPDAGLLSRAGRAVGEAVEEPARRTLGALAQTVPGRILGDVLLDFGVGTAPELGFRAGRMAAREGTAAARRGTNYMADLAANRAANVGSFDRFTPRSGGAGRPAAQVPEMPRMDAEPTPIPATPTEPLPRGTAVQVPDGRIGTVKGSAGGKVLVELQREIVSDAAGNYQRTGNQFFNADELLPAPAAAATAPTLPQVRQPSVPRALSATETSAALATIPQEVRSVGQFGFVQPPSTYVPDLALEREHVDNIRRLTASTLQGRTAKVNEVANGTGLFGGEASPNALYRFDEDVPDEAIRRTAAIQGLAYGQDQQVWYRQTRQGDPEETAALVITGPNFAPLSDEVITAVVNRLRAADALGEYGGATRDGNHLMALNLKRYTEMDDPTFMARVGRALDEVGETYNIVSHPSTFYAEHLDGPSAYVQALQGRPDAIRAARNALVDAAPEYERYAARTGADVDATRTRIAETLAALDEQARAITTPFETRTYSRLERAIDAAPFEKGTPQQWQAALSKGVAAGEREFTGIDEFLASTDAKTLTKAEVRGAFEQGRIRLGETQLGGTAVREQRLAIADRLGNAQKSAMEAERRITQQYLDANNYSQIEKQAEALRDQLDAAMLPIGEAEGALDRRMRSVVDNPEYGRLGFDTPQQAVSAMRQVLTREGSLRRVGWDIDPQDARELEELARNWNNTKATVENAPDVRQLTDSYNNLSMQLTRIQNDARDYLRTQLDELPETRALREAQFEYDNAQQRTGQFESYTQPGAKENYREVLLTLDGQEVGQSPYRSAHWGDVENPLLHVRMSDRQLPDGQKALFVEEIQSDWHQAGRKRGYEDLTTLEYRNRLSLLSLQYENKQRLAGIAERDGNFNEADRLWNEADAAANEWNTINNEFGALRESVPNAPFKKTPEWTELGLKRVIDEAVQGGYDRVVLVTGQQAADNFDLSRQISRLDWDTPDNGKTFRLLGNGDELASDVPLTKLPDYVGKDIADKIAAAGAEQRRGVLQGVDLKVGGDGMRAFYDKLVPNTLRDLGKSMGLKIELEPVNLIEGRGQNLSFRITPEAREKIATEGMRLYDITGVAGEGLRQAVTRPGMAAAVGAGVGALTDEEDRFGGAIRGAFVGAGVGTAGKVTAQQLLRARAALKASGFPQELAEAYARASASIDFSGKAAKALARRAKGSFKQMAQRALAGYEDSLRFLDRLSEGAEAAGMAPERSVATALDRALGSQATAARALANGVGVERGGVIDPITREVVNEPLEDVIKVLGDDRNPEKVAQGFTYIIGLRRLGRYDQAATRARQWDTLAGDAAAQAEAGRAARPAAGVDDPALAERLTRQGEIEAERALGPRPNPEQVYGGDIATMEADRAVVDAFGQQPEFIEFANRMQQYLDSVGEYMVKSGVWTPQQYAAMRESDAFYIPFKRLLENVQASQGRPMKGGVTPGQVTAGVKTFTGSRLMLANPAEALGEYVAASITRADRYRVGEAFIETALESDPSLLTRLDANDPRAKSIAQLNAEEAFRVQGYTEEEAVARAEMFRRIDRNNPVIMRNGPEGREYYLLNDKDYAAALEALNPDDPGAVKALVQVLAPLKRITTAFATGYAPSFWLGVNLPRDIITAYAQNPNMTVGDMAVGFREAFKSIAGKSEMVERITREGAGQVSQFGADPDVAGIMRSIAPTTTGQQVRATIGTGVSAPLRGLERVGRAAEMPMRLAAARSAERTAAARGVSEAGQRALGSRAYSRATVDFRRKAGFGLERFFEQTVPFYGAAKKGGVAFARAVKNNPKAVSAAATAVVLGASLEHILGGGTMGGVFEGDEAARQEQTNRLAWERARSIQLGDFKLALPQELAVVAAATRVALASLERDDPFAYQQLQESLLSAIPPIYSDIARGEVIAPFPVVRQLQEIAQNRSSFTGRPIVPESMTGAGVGRGVLPEQRRYPTTSPTFDVMASAARGLGFEQASPLQAEYLMRGITGRFTPAVTAITDVAAQPMTGRESEGRVRESVMRQPLNPLSSFVVQPSRRTQAEEEFYRLRNELEAAQGTYSRLDRQYQTAVERNDAAGEERVKREITRMRKDPRFEAVWQNTGARLEDKRAANPEYQTAFDKLKLADELLEDVRTQQELVQEAVANRRMSQAEARKRLDQLNLERSQVYRRAFDVLSKQSRQRQ